MPGLEHLFAGLVGGIGETTLSLQKEKRQREDQQQSQQLALFTHLLTVPDLKPEVRQELFKQALDTASGGNKKLSEKVHGMLGHLLGPTGDAGDKSQQSESKSEAEGQQAPSVPSPTNPMGLGSAQPAPQQQGLPSKFEQPSRSIFYSPDEQVQQEASRAGAIAKATTQAQVDITQPAELAKIREAAHLEAEQREKEGYQIQGFTKPDGSGLVRPVFVNSMTGQSKTGTAVPEFVSQQMMGQAELLRTQQQIQQEAGPNVILQSMGVDPSKASPDQRTKAAQKWGGLQVSAQEADTAAKNANALESILRARYSQATGGKGQMTDSQLAIDYDRQWKEYDSRQTKIAQAVSDVNTNKVAASEAYDQASIIQKMLLDRQQKEGEEDPDLQKQGITYAAYRALIAKGAAHLQAASAAGQAAQDRFGQWVEFGMGGDNKKWPYIKDTSPEFIYKAPGGGIPDMPTRGGRRSGKGGSANDTEIDVPDDILNKLYKP